MVDTEEVPIIGEEPTAETQNGASKGEENTSPGQQRATKTNETMLERVEFPSWEDERW